MAIRTLSLFAGGAGLDLGVELALPNARTVCFVEREAHAAAALVARMAEGSLAAAAVWSDVGSFDGRAWRGAVDLVVGGFPCQDISVAGKGAGLAGARSGLWFEYARILDEVEPDLVLIENVSALRSRGLGVVLGDLAALGFDAEWDCYRASDVGAPHRRERIFILAHRRGVELRHKPWRCSGPDVANADGQRWAEGLRRGSVAPGRTFTHHAGEDVGHPYLQSVNVPDRAREDVRDVAGAGRSVGDANDARLEGRCVAEPERADEWAAWPPGPEERDRWVDYLRVRPDAEPSVCRGAHGVAGGLEYRTERLRLLGNGVVPQVAAVAFRDLYRRAMTP